jgi:hydrogenase maturation protease
MDTISKVIAIGSPHGDDQVAWAIADHLHVNNLLPLVAEWLCLDRPGLSLLPYLQSGGVALVIDAADFGQQIGDVCFLVPHELMLNQRVKMTSGHSWGVQDTFELAAALSIELPMSVVCAVQLEQCYPLADMSLSLKDQIPAIAQAIVERLQH